MPAKTKPKAKTKATATKRSTKSSKKKTAKKAVNKIEAEVKQMSSVCRTCHTLPVGSVELVSLLLVLVFSLTAVLVTSVHAYSIQSAEMAQLEMQLNK